MLRLRAFVEFLLLLEAQRIAPVLPEAATVLDASLAQVNIRVQFENVVDKRMAIAASGSIRYYRTDHQIVMLIVESCR